MAIETLLLLTAGVFVIALLYSSVGHAGASGYIAVMSLLSLAPAEIKPIALALNILVASIGSWQFWRAGHFSWGLFWPFALLSVPFAFLGGYLNLPTHAFKVAVGIVLLLSAAQFLFRPPAEGEPQPGVLRTRRVHAHAARLDRQELPCAIARQVGESSRGRQPARQRELFREPDGEQSGEPAALVPHDVERAVQIEVERARRRLVRDGDVIALARAKLG